MKVVQGATTSNVLADIPRIVEEHRVRAVLEVLAVDSFSGSANDSVLASIMDELALGGIRSVVRATLDRMELLGLLRSRKFENYVVVSLTELGWRVAQGKQRVEGVARAFGDEGSFRNGV